MTDFEEAREALGRAHLVKAVVRTNTVIGADMDSRAEEAAVFNHLRHRIAEEMRPFMSPRLSFVQREFERGVRDNTYTSEVVVIPSADYSFLCEFVQRHILKDNDNA